MTSLVSVEISAQQRLGASTLYHITVKSFVGVKEVRNLKYANFQGLHRELTKEKIPMLDLPPKRPLGNMDKTKRVANIARGLERLLNAMMQNPDLAGRPQICKFLNTTPEIALHGFKGATLPPPVPTQHNQTALHHEAPVLQPHHPVQSVLETGLPAQQVQQADQLSHAQQLEVIPHLSETLQPEFLERQQSPPVQQFAPNQESLYFPVPSTTYASVQDAPYAPVSTADGSSQISASNVLEQYPPVPLQQFTPVHGTALQVLEQFSPVQSNEIPIGLEGYMDASHLAHESLHANGQNSMIGGAENGTHPSYFASPTPSASKNCLTPASGKAQNKSVNRERVLSPNVYEGQYSGSDDQIVTAWIEELLQIKLDQPLQECLKSGVILCKLINRIQPQTIKRINNAAMPFPQRENIKAFCDAAREMGVPDSENFNTDDLFENRNMKQVLVCLFSLGRQCYYAPAYEGPALGRPERAQLGAAYESKFEVKGDALWGKGNSQFKAADGRPSSGQVTKGSLAHLGHSPLRP